MGSNRSQKMGSRKGFAGLIDRLRFHEASRQGLGLLLVLVCALSTVPGESRVIAGFVLAVVGQVWRIYAAGVIYKNKQLATTGAYSLVRHPLYLGNFLILVGFTLACGNWIVLLLVAFFFLFYYPAAIRYEDHKLEGIFGDDWRAWSANIPGMFPTGLKWQANTEAEWDMQQSLIRNGELIYTIFMAGCAVLLWYRAAL
jgi:protein-S-isoprenylcysteine O-methyltransferase Ste14